MLLLLAGLVGCTASSGRGATPITDGAGFFDQPWPSDARMVDGHPDVAGFPHEGQYPIVDAYLDAIADVDGAGTNSPVYVRFADAIDPALLPSPAASLEPSSPVYLMDIGIGSTHRGEKVPIDFEWTDAETAWQPEHLLAAAPVFGFPLQPATRYALVFKSPLVAPQPIDWAAPGFAQLESTLVAKGTDPDIVSFAVVFTTQDPVRETARIARAIHDELTVLPPEPTLTLHAEYSGYRVYTGHVALPVWQQGERPYHELGTGGFAFDADGRPQIYRYERVQFSLSVPPGSPPEGGWPLVLYSHGTGGDNFTFCSGNATDEGGVLADEGVTMFGVSQPLHGDRATPDTNVELDSFNFYNPAAGRTNFRQGALDQVYLARALTEAAPAFEADGAPIPVNPDRVAFFGHSQGGLVGAIAAPFVSPDLRGVGLSGAGGGLTLTILLRKDPIDLSATLEALLGFDEGETLTPFHPVLGLIQTLADATDPVNYAPYWYAEHGDWQARADASPMPMALTEGLLDAYTPSVTAEALAAAGRMPIVGDPASMPEALTLRGLTPMPLPAQDNVAAWDGSAVTAGVAQFPSDGHFAVYDNRSARRFYRDFLTSALGDGAVLDE